ncbi:DUF2589 domain-containing protein [Francisella sp. SYW-2]|uniref:DUF2589 domain-containing protein n=1 Tax=Francisella sp. SYW-2 TaxID=2610886 RepID=UPI00123DE587|nr:DUF2589 domain-containing protein [Francisella sp. SYW-2]
MFKKDDQAQPLTSQLLTDITKGLQYAASSTHKMCVQHHLSMLGQFFDNDADGNLTPKTINLELGPEHKLNVPIISLMAPTSLTLDEMKVSLAVELENNDTDSFGQAIGGINSTETGSSFKVKINSSKNKGSEANSNEMKIDLVFKSINPPEGLQRIIEEYSNLIQPLSQSDIKERI